MSLFVEVSKGTEKKRSKTLNVCAEAKGDGMLSAGLQGRGAWERINPLYTDGTFIASLCRAGAAKMTGNSSCCQEAWAQRRMVAEPAC